MGGIHGDGDAVTITDSKLAISHGGPKQEEEDKEEEEEEEEDGRFKCHGDGAGRQSARQPEPIGGTRDAPRA